MLILKLKQAECALADGRLDEAFELLAPDHVRAHRRGQHLTGKLARALIQRGKVHLDSGRATLALSDCHKAAKLAGNIPEVAELQSAATDIVVGEQQAQRQQERLVVAARDHIYQGHFTIGQQLLAGAGESAPQSRIGLLSQELAAKRAMFESRLTRAQAALQREDWHGAVQELAKARKMNGDDARVIELVARACSTLRDRAQAAVDEGRLELGASLLERLAALEDRAIETEQLRRALGQCQAAWQWIERGQPRQAEEIVRRLPALLPSARWVAQAQEQLEQACAAMDELRSGPLGLLGATGGSPAPLPRMEMKAPLPPSPLAPRKEPAGIPASTVADGDPSALPGRFLIQIDGVGSFCVLRRPHVKIGSISSSMAGGVDLGLVAEPNLPIATIERDEDDYFLRCDSMVAVNDKPVRSKLLASGDRIALSPRCRMSFSLPSAASTSAVLDLSGSRFPRSDCRRVVLLDRELVIGPGAATHIRVDALAEPVVLHVRDGKLRCQSKAAVLINEHPADPGAPLEMHAHVNVGPLSLVITKC